MFGLSSLGMKLIGVGIGLLALLGLVLGLKHYKHLADARGQSLVIICQSTRDASGNPKMKCSEVPVQIKFMGETIVTLTSAVHRQNEMVDAQKQEIDRQKAAADQASQKADKRAETPKATAGRLEASARSGERLTKPCEPSTVLKGAWQ